MEGKDSAASFPLWSKSSVVLDIQCFKGNRNELLVKEASVVEVDSGTLVLHHVAQPPYDRDTLTQDKLRESYWLVKHCHGLEWNSGDIPYYVLLDKLRACLTYRSVIYVKGVEKKEYVMNKLITPVAGRSPPIVLDMMEIGCESLSTVANLLSANILRCGRHRNTNHRCALANCTLLRGWLILTAKDKEYKTSPLSSTSSEFEGEDEVDYV